MKGPAETDVMHGHVSHRSINKNGAEFWFIESDFSESYYLSHWIAEEHGVRRLDVGERVIFRGKYLLNGRPVVSAIRRECDPA
jgi:hypothetical protein